MVHLRYVSRLLLVGVQRKQSGSYTATVANKDELREVTFNLEVTGEGSECVFVCVCVFVSLCVSFKEPK